MSPATRKPKLRLTDVDVGAIGQAVVNVVELLHRETRARTRPRMGRPGASARRTLRIALGRITQETNALSPVATTLADFENVHLLEGKALLDVCEWNTEEVRGFKKNAELSGFVDGVRAYAYTHGYEVEFVPLVSAWAVSSGPLTRSCFEDLCARLVEPLRHGAPVDAVLLSLHGAMGVSDLALSDRESAESEIVRRVREVQPNVPIGVTLDLHANLVSGLIERSTVVQGYRTNPHRDHASVGQEVGELIVRTALKEIRPVMAWRSLPMFLGGSPTIDFLAPVNRIFARMKEMEVNESVLASSSFFAHPWNSHPELGWSTLVVTDGDVDLAERCVAELAAMCWDTRHRLPTMFISPEQAIDDARRAKWARRLGVCVIADASDVVTAGAPGDNTDVLRSLIDRAQGMRCYASVRDPELVATLWEKNRPGDHVSVDVGGKLDSARQRPLHVEAKIVSLPRAHGVGRMVVLEVGTIYIVAVEGPAMAIRPSFFSNAGLKVRNADVVVVKNFFPFLMYFVAYVRMVRFVRTTGVTDFDAVHEISFRGPMHPRDHVPEWESADARRRAL